MGLERSEKIVGRKINIWITIAVAAACTVAAGLIFLGYEWKSTQSELNEVREELHVARVVGHHLRPDTVRWSIDMYDRQMDFYEQEAEAGRWYYWKDDSFELRVWAFPLLRYIADASSEGLIPSGQASSRINRMEDYLDDQPGPDESSERELKEINGIR